MGGFAGVIVERIIGQPFDRLVIRRAKEIWDTRARNRVEENIHLNDELAIIANTAIFVRQFVPGGFGINDIATRIQDNSGGLNAQLKNLLPPEREVEDTVIAFRKSLEENRRMWNGINLALVRADVSRDSITEVAQLTMTFCETEYARHLALSKIWENLPIEKRRGLNGNLLREVDSELSTSFGLNCTVETHDGQVLLTKRSVFTYGGNEKWHISFNEGLSKMDRQPGARLDLYRAFARGLREEIGIEEQQVSNFNERLKIHSLILDVDRYQWGLLAHLDLRGTEITSTAIRLSRNIGAAHDDWESSEIKFIPFTDSADEVIQELREGADWLAHGLLNLALSTTLRHPNRAKEIRFALFKAN